MAHHTKMVRVGSCVCVPNRGYTTIVWMVRILFLEVGQHFPTACSIKPCPLAFIDRVPPVVECITPPICMFQPNFS